MSLCRQQACSSITRCHCFPITAARPQHRDCTSRTALSRLTKHTAAVPACIAAMQGMYPYTLHQCSLSQSVLVPLPTPPHMHTGVLGAPKTQNIDIETSHISLRCTGVSCPMGAAARGPDQRQQAPDSPCSPDICVLLVQLHASGPGDGSDGLHHTSGHIPGCRHAHHLIHPQGDLSGEATLASHLSSQCWHRHEIISEAQLRDCQRF